MLGTPVFSSLAVAVALYVVILFFVVGIVGIQVVVGFFVFDRYGIRGLRRGLGFYTVLTRPATASAAATARSLLVAIR